jgi:hypothetical protein
METKTKTTVRDRVDVMLIESARTRNYVLTIQAYCDNRDCPTRQIHVWIKDHDDQLLALVCGPKGGLRCPVCRHRVRIHGALDRQDERTGTRQ